MAQPTNSDNASAAASADPTAQGVVERQPPAIRYVDRADLPETFADSITSLVFDGQTLRIEFGVTRFDEMKPNSQITGRRYPACRLVLPPGAASELIARLQQTAAAVAQGRAAKAPSRAAAEAEGAPKG